MAITHVVHKANASVSAAGTFAVTKDASANLASNLEITDGTAFYTIRFVRYFPNNIAAADWQKSRPCVIYVSNGGFNTSPYDNVVNDPFLGATTGLASMGIPCFSCECRIESQDPYTPDFTNKAFTDSDITNGINATTQDIDRMLQFVRSNMVVTDTYTIHPDQIFLMGVSSGAQASQIYCIRVPAHGVKGIIAYNAGFGLDGLGAGDTADLRAIADETDVVNNDPPAVFFGGDVLDTVIGAAHVDTLATKYELDLTNNDVFRDDTEDHLQNPTDWGIGHASFPPAAVTSQHGGGTINDIDAVREFIIDVTTGDADVTTNLSFS